MTCMNCKNDNKVVYVITYKDRLEILCEECFELNKEKIIYNKHITNLRKVSK